MKGGVQLWMGAAYSGYTETLGLLIREGTDVNAKAVNGLTALKEAEKEGRDGIVGLLKAAGARE